MITHNRVMLVDDEAPVRVSWKRYLSGHGFKVATANDGSSAIAALVDHPADVVVSDLKMPGIDGLKLLEWIHDRQPETRFILLTGHGSEDVERRALELGAHHYLNKPISPDELAAVVTAAMHLKPRPALDAAHVVETTLTVHATLSPSSEVALAVDETKASRGKIRGALEVTGALIAAPFMGLAFVIFLPVIGFVTLFWFLASSVFGIFKKPESTGA